MLRASHPGPFAARAELLLWDPPAPVTAVLEVAPVPAAPPPDAIPLPAPEPDREAEVGPGVRPLAEPVAGAPFDCDGCCTDDPSGPAVKDVRVWTVEPHPATSRP